jgi:hypothetical protein
MFWMFSFKSLRKSHLLHLLSGKRKFSFVVFGPLNVEQFIFDKKWYGIVSRNPIRQSLKQISRFRGTRRNSGTLWKIPETRLRFTSPVQRVTKHRIANVCVLVSQQSHDQLRRRPGNQRHDYPLGEDQRPHHYQCCDTPFWKLLLCS